jgi:hypothetical protein
MFHNRTFTAYNLIAVQIMHRDDEKLTVLRTGFKWLNVNIVDLIDGQSVQGFYVIP